MSGPERIWAMEWRQETRGKHLVGGYTETPAYQGCTEYIRADLHAAAPLRALGILSARDQMRQQTHNLSPEEIAERDRPKSRQERRQLERLREKGRA